MNTFTDYLNNNRSLKLGKEQMFVPAQRGQCGLEYSAIEAAEERLGCKFPDGYRTFLTVLGPGMWAEATICHPDESYAFDEECDNMCGFVTLAFSVDGAGNYIAFNPQEEQNRIYFCCHDPVGYAVVADSFEQWIELITAAKIKNPKRGILDLYGSLTIVEPEHSQEQEPPNRSWWQFWK